MDIDGLVELLSVAKVSVQRPNEHLPYVTITLLYQAESNADTLLELLKEVGATVYADERRR